MDVLETKIETMQDDIKNLEVNNEIIQGDIKEENQELKQKFSNIGRAKITESQIGQILTLYNEGLSYQKIAESVNLSKGTVCNYVHKYLKSDI